MLCLDFRQNMPFQTLLIICRLYQACQCISSTVCTKLSISCYVSNRMDAMIIQFHTHIEEASLMSVWGVEKEYVLGFNFLPVSCLIQLYWSQSIQRSCAPVLSRGPMLHEFQPVDYHVHRCLLWPFRRKIYVAISLRIIYDSKNTIKMKISSCKHNYGRFETEK